MATCQACEVYQQAVTQAQSLCDEEEEQEVLIPRLLAALTELSGLLLKRGKHAVAAIGRHDATRVTTCAADRSAAGALRAFHGGWRRARARRRRLGKSSG